MKNFIFFLKKRSFRENIPSNGHLNILREGVFPFPPSRFFKPPSRFLALSPQNQSLKSSNVNLNP